MFVVVYCLLSIIFVVMCRKPDGNGVLKQFHHRIIFKDTQYFIDGITVGVCLVNHAHLMSDTPT